MSANTSQRLAQVFQSAQRLPFHPRSRLVFFSDVHRGDNSWADEFARNQALFSYALNYYFKAGFTYIEVGDGDELTENASFDVILRAHLDIFELMRRFYALNRLYLIFGNHDIERRDPRLVERTLYSYRSNGDARPQPLFTGIRVHEGLVLKHSGSGNEIFVTHGHQGGLWTDRLVGPASLLLRRFWRPLQLLGLQNPTSISWNSERRYKVEEKIRHWIAENRQPTICGHTHRPAFPEVGDVPYFNTGSCVHPRWITGLEIEKDHISQVRWMIQPDRNGALCVQRDVLDGPENLEDYFEKIGNQVDALE